MHNIFEPETQSYGEITDPFVGRKIDKYCLECKIGSGGMGAVYKARHLMFDKQVAIKLLSPQVVSELAVFERFRREAEALARLKHVNVIGVTDFGRTLDGMAYLVMEYVDGKSLRQILNQEKTLSLKRVIFLLKQICSAVTAAHRKGIVHRDLKPENVMVEIVDGEEVVKVLDFGIAKLRDLATGNSLQSESNGWIGTPQYMSPEQCEGQNLEASSDVYSLGVMVYEMLSGQIPFSGKPTTLIIQHINKDPIHLTAVVQGIPEMTANCVMRALSKNPLARFKSAIDFAESLEKSVLDIQCTENSVIQDFEGKIVEIQKTSTPSSENQSLINEGYTNNSVSINSGLDINLTQSQGIDFDQSSFSFLDFKGNVLRYTKYTAITIFLLTCAYFVLMIFLLRSEVNLIGTDVVTVLKNNVNNINNVQSQIREIASLHNISINTVYLKIDPLKGEITASFKYVKTILGIPMNYEVDQSIENVYLSIGDLAALPLDNVELVNISREEIESFRTERLQKTVRK